jgi:hypothetical protein
MGYLSRILNNCNETCILSLRSKEEKLSLRQKIEMKIHLRFCKCCQNFDKQSDKIDESMKAYFEDIADKPPVKASDDFRARMKEQFK